MNCEHCGKKINHLHAVPLELDQRTNTYHDFRDVPEQLSQGWFDFGPDCAKKMRKEAIAARSSESK